MIMAVAGSSESSLPIVIIGAGGHAKVLLNCLQQAGRTAVIGLVDADQGKWGQTVLGVPVLGGDEVLQRFSGDGVALVNGLGSTQVSELRSRIFAKYCDAGYRFAQVVHPSAVVAPSAELGEGAQLMAGCVVQPDARIGANVIVNTGALVDHDCCIGASTHISPGATLSGGVIIGDGCHIGTGAVVIQGIHIGRHCTIGAGAVVIADVPDGSTVVGVPARPLLPRQQ